MKTLKIAASVSAVVLTLSGCISFEGYIGLDSKGGVELAEASTGSAASGWESYVTGTESEFNVLDEEGALSGAVETKIGNSFDFFVSESNEIFSSEILNKSSLFNEADCSFGVSEDLYIHFCIDETIENENIFNNAVIEGEWVESFQPRTIYGQTINIPVYSIEGELSGIALEFYTNYINLTEKNYNNVGEFISTMNSPYLEEDGTEIIPDYITEPVGTLTVFFNTPDSEILQAKGDSVVDFDSDFFTIDLEEYNPGDKISLSIIVSDVSVSKIYSTPGSETPNKTTTASSQETNWYIALAATAVLVILLLSILLRRLRVKS